MLAPMPISMTLGLGRDKPGEGQIVKELKKEFAVALLELTPGGSKQARLKALSESFTLCARSQHRACFKLRMCFRSIRKEENKHDGPRTILKALACRSKLREARRERNCWCERTD